MTLTWIAMNYKWYSHIMLDAIFPQWTPAIRRNIDNQIGIFWNLLQKIFIICWIEEEVEEIIVISRRLIITNCKYTTYMLVKYVSNWHTINLACFFFFERMCRRLNVVAGLGNLIEGLPCLDFEWGLLDVWQVLLNESNSGGENKCFEAVS